MKYVVLCLILLASLGASAEVRDCAGKLSLPNGRTVTVFVSFTGRLHDSQILNARYAIDEYDYTDVYAEFAHFPKDSAFHPTRCSSPWAIGRVSWCKPLKRDPIVEKIVFDVYTQTQGMVVHAWGTKDPGTITCYSRTPEKHGDWTTWGPGGLM